ncbi:MAG: hypothetical protein ABIO76_12335, partial [Ginsengibacter sp.]
MGAYKRQDLFNRQVQEESLDEYRKGTLSQESYSRILLSYPEKLYTPNFFIRIALGLLTCVALLFSSGFFGLLLATGGMAGAIFYCFLMGITYYFVLEMFIKKKRFFNAGVDNVLMVVVIGFILSAFLINNFNESFILLSVVVTILSFYMAARFTDAFMASIAYIAFFVFVFLFYIKLGSLAKATAPFFMLIFSAVIFLIMNFLLRKGKMNIFSFCIRSVMFLTIVTFYLSVNYFVVRKGTEEMFGLAENAVIPFGWFFWIATFLIPAGYLVYGIRKKDFHFIRTALLLIAATVFTIRYYFHLLPIEIAMLIAGIVLIAVFYFLMRLLK